MKNTIKDIVDSVTVWLPWILMLLLLISIPIVTGRSCAKQESQCEKSLKCNIGTRTIVLNLEKSLYKYQQLLNSDPIDEVKPYLCIGYKAKNYEIIKDEYKDWIGHVEGGLGKATTHGPVYKVTIKGEICTP